MTKSTAFDFDALDLATLSDKPFEFELEHPGTGEGLGVFVSVVGAESETFQQYLRAAGDALRRKEFEAQRKGKPEEPLLLADEEETGLRAIAACVKGWRTVNGGGSDPVILIAGQRHEFSADNVLVLLRKFRWVRWQLNKATGTLGNYLGNSPAASASSPKSSSS